MSINSKLTRNIALLCFSLFVLLLVQLPAAGQCENATDQKLVADMYAKIKADKNLASQIRHINVAAVNLVIKLQGYTNKRAEYDRLVGFAMKMACVKMVNTNDLSPSAPDSGDAGAQRMSAGCASGMKACGDICIPESDICNIEAYLGVTYEPFRFLNWAAINDYRIGAAPVCGMN